MNGITFTRQELHQLVWSEPLTKIASKFNLTPPAITSACKETEVPVPPNGHWQKVKHGKGIPVPALSEGYKGAGSIFIPEKNSPPPDVLNEYKEQIRSCKNISFQVPHRLTNPDPLIEKAQERLESEAKIYGDKKMLLTTASQNLNIKVGKESIARGCRIFDTVIKALKQRGHNIVINFATTSVSVLGNEIEIAMRERSYFFQEFELVHRGNDLMIRYRSKFFRTRTLAAGGSGFLYLVPRNEFRQSGSAKNFHREEEPLIGVQGQGAGILLCWSATAK